MQIQDNPWSFISTDPATAAITAATGLTLNADGTVTITTTGALTFNPGAANATSFTVFGATASAYNGYYTLQQGVSGGTTFRAIPNFLIPAGTAQSGSGTIAQVLYPNMIRAEDISWQNLTTTLAVSGVMQLVNRNGFDVWRAAIGATDTLPQLNRGKVFWINGLAPISIPATTQILITVN